MKADTSYTPYVSSALPGFYRAKPSVARYCHGKLSVPSVRPSVTLVDCDHTRWNSSKIISRMISLGTWLSADPNVTDLFQREHPKFKPEVLIFDF